MQKENHVLVFGGRGQLGLAIAEMAKSVSSAEVTILGHEECDITQLESVERAVLKYNPTWIINSAAWTNTKTVKNTPEGDMCYQINARAPVVLAQVSNKLGIKMFQISTDFVFYPNGVHLENQEVEVGNQVNWYGQTKAMAEVGLLESGFDNIYVARVSATFGPSSTDSNFARKVLRNAVNKSESGDKSPFKAVVDEITRPTSTWFVARQLLQLMGEEKLEKVYHVVSSGLATRYEQMRFILESAGFDFEIVPVFGTVFDPDFVSPRISVLENTILKSGSSWQEQTLEVLKPILNGLTCK